MLRSMTGFGRCLVETPQFTQQWEIKSVNSRYLDLKWRLPPVARNYEAYLEKVVRKFASRGRVEIVLNLNSPTDRAIPSAFDATRAASMLDALAELAHNRGDTYHPDYNTLFQLPGLWEESIDEADETFIKQLEEGLSMALEDWNESRTTEGKALAQDMKARILRMEEWLEVISQRAPAIREERISVVRDRLTELLASLGSELDESRFLQEVVILTDKLDVSEELTRLHTHLDRLSELLNAGKDAGRRLDFTLQECFREINTCGNKTPDVQLSRLVVDFKNELEKCREQVQNLE